MNLEIIPIGTGYAFTELGLQTNYLVRCGESQLLIDCGTTAPRALRAVDLSLTDIDNVYLSHLHLDHAGGLFQLAILRYLQQQERPNLILHEELAENLWNSFLSGQLCSVVDATGKAQKGTAEMFFSWHPIAHTIETSKESMEVGDIHINLVRMQHVPGMPCHGLLVNDRIFITTDTVFLPELLETLANQFGLQAIFHDCSFEEQNHYVHTTYGQLQSLPNDLRELLILTHYEDDVEGRAGIELNLGKAGQIYSFD